MASCRMSLKLPPRIRQALPLESTVALLIGAAKQHLVAHSGEFIRAVWWTVVTVLATTRGKT